MENLNTYIAPAQIAVPKLGGLSSKDEAKKAAAEFEAMFAAEMFRPMFEQEDVDPMFGGGQTEKIYRSMLVDEFGKEISKSGGLGIAASVEKELLKLQEAK